MTPRHAFTLIELMIVIAIIAIIAAIAIPNLLESRVTSQEAAAATALRTGLLPAQVQFQAGDYCDLDTNGVGSYAVDGVIGLVASGGASGAVNPYNALCGGNGVCVGTNIALTLLAPAYQTTGSYTTAAATTVGSTSLGTVWPEVSGFCFKTPLTQTSPSSASATDGTGERVWAAMTFPQDDNQGRKFFAISTAGNIYMSKPAATASTGAVNVGGLATSVGAIFTTALNKAPSTSTYLPYHR